MTEDLPLQKVQILQQLLTHLAIWKQSTMALTVCRPTMGIRKYSKYPEHLEELKRLQRSH